MRLISNGRKALLLLGTGALLIASGLAPSASPQEQHKAPVIPDKYTNLKVLPADITKAQLLPIMKGFCITFEKRCSYCHAVTDDLTSGDFASDEKPSKVVARDLLRAIVELKTPPPAAATK
ncbi:MAG: photosynthetic reaction center cytochrome c subunit family protein [Candidatus Acidiferrales bacterium]